MNIILVSYMDFTGPGVIHMFHFANGLVRGGHQVLFLLNGRKETVTSLEEKPLFRIEEVGFRHSGLRRGILRAVERFHPHIVHIWTPRNTPARIGLELKYRYQLRLVIHYEDDEDVLVRQHDFSYFRFLSFAVDAFRNPEKWVWAHPFTYHWVNTYADALTVISPDYARVLQARWGLPAYLLIPGVNLDLFSPRVEPDHHLCERFDLTSKRVLIYGGSIAQFYEFDTILEAVRQLKSRFPNLLVLQYGRNFMKDKIGQFLQKYDLQENFFFAGHVPHHQVPAFLAAGDILVQPGQNTQFNRHRLPSKLPEYLATGKPVITFSCGIGEKLEHLRDAWKLELGTPEELAGAISHIFENPDLQKSLAVRGRQKAEQLFSWQRSTDSLVDIYRSTLIGIRQVKAEQVFEGEQELAADIRELTRCPTSSKSEDLSEFESSDVWEELLGLRQFHRKATATLAYRCYFKLKLLREWFRKNTGENLRST